MYTWMPSKYFAVRQLDYSNACPYTPPIEEHFVWGITGIYLCPGGFVWGYSEDIVQGVVLFGAIIL